ncbi:MAG: copper homeostasis protein CutC [Flavobacterium sp.]|uniref:copper homeostasis protein CutC n=1 Tax=Flavobacterium sp. TaxID=239 RepID=UPI00263782AD|nr:copper homeostasis protein CutC [Flavobacterium sp.]MDD5149205.1 copper homeostasis protein CutC [Flavobacterium sp.]
MLLEICASSYQSAINAQNAGAYRIELCSELAIGGITPSYGLLKNVLETLSIPVYVLIRPRSGNFTYSDEEFNSMKADIKLCKELGCHGIVSGILHTDNTLDIERTKELVELSKPLPFTFNRAFDWIENSFEALDELMNIGVGRILTSGKSDSAEEGIKLLEDLNKKANNRLLILPGGGINVGNAHLFKKNGFEEIHCSASTIKYVIESVKIPMNNEMFFDERIIVYSDYDKIKSILKSII